MKEKRISRRTFVITHNLDGYHLVDFDGNVLSSLRSCDQIAILDPEEEFVRIVQ